VHHSKFRWLMSALGHKRTFRSFRSMSALPPKADIRRHKTNVRFVPIARVRSVYSISLFARATATVSLYIVGTTTSPVAYEAAFPWAVLSVPPVDQ